MWARATRASRSRNAPAIAPSGQSRSHTRAGLSSGGAAIAALGEHHHPLTWEGASKAQRCSGRLWPTWRERRAPALWRRGEVQLDRLAAGTRARLGGELSGAGLKDLRRDLLGAVDADPGAEHPAARAVATRLVRCQSAALAHHGLHAGSGAARGQSAAKRGGRGPLQACATLQGGFVQIHYVT